jgi:oligopeptide transport system ATP-binding protein
LDTVGAVMKTPRHPYTQGLLRAVALGEEARSEDVATAVRASASAKTHASGSALTASRGLPPRVAEATLAANVRSAGDAPALADAFSRSAEPAVGLVPSHGLPLTGADVPVALAISGLSVQFPVPRGWFARPAMLRAVDDVSLDLRAGEALGVVGESGSGKSTLARAALLLIRPGAGQVVWMGRSLEGLSARALKPLRRELQIVFQDPLASLDPRMTVGEIVEEPLRVHQPERNAGDRTRAVAEMLVRVGIAPDLINRYPHEFSGGQCQRIGIARAMILKPRLLVCDEPVSALDVTIQEQIVTLLADLKREYGMCILFVSHNLAVVRRLCDRVLVLYLGRMMELASSERLYTRALHPYTRDLLEAVPIPDPDVQPARLTRVLGGEPPSPLNPPSGCVYRTRCPHAKEVCGERVPTWEEAEVGHWVACHRWRELLRE